MVAMAVVGSFAYVIIAYVALPFGWKHYEHQRGLDGISMLTQTKQGIHGDPINVGLVGTDADVLCAMHSAGWEPADPVTLRSSIKIIGSVVLDRPYPAAPVSDLFLLGRKEDLAFEKSDGKSADRRHHVRLWEVLPKGDEGRPVWLGAVTYDRGVGISHYTGQVTHHIAADIDAERDGLTNNLKSAHVVTTDYTVSGIGLIFNGRNGGGDRYFTDGEVKVSRLVSGCDEKATSTTDLEGPTLIEMRNAAWKALAGVRWFREH